MASTRPDLAFNQLHLYVCMMIELRNYALTDKTRGLFELCKTMLREKVRDFPLAEMVINRYVQVDNAHEMSAELCKTKYTDKYVEDVNGIMETIMLNDCPDAMIDCFKQLTNLTSEDC